VDAGSVVVAAGGLFDPSLALFADDGGVTVAVVVLAVLFVDVHVDAAVGAVDGDRADGLLEEVDLGTVFGFVGRRLTGNRGQRQRERGDRDRGDACSLPLVKIGPSSR